MVTAVPTPVPHIASDGNADRYRHTEDASAIVKTLAGFHSGTRKPTLGIRPRRLHYPQSVEPRITEAQGGTSGPYTSTWINSIRDTDIAPHLLFGAHAPLHLLWPQAQSTPHML